MDNVLPPLSYAPDGLYESDIDVLIAEYFTADEPQTFAPDRHTRRVSHQIISAGLRGPTVEPNRVNDAAA